MVLVNSEFSFLAAGLRLLCFELWLRWFQGRLIMAPQPGTWHLYRPCCRPSQRSGGTSASGLL